MIKNFIVKSVEWAIIGVYENQYSNVLQKNTHQVFFSVQSHSDLSLIITFMNIYISMDWATGIW